MLRRTKAWLQDRKEAFFRGTDPNSFTLIVTSPDLKETEVAHDLTPEELEFCCWVEDTAAKSALAATTHKAASLWAAFTLAQEAVMHWWLPYASRCSAALKKLD
jgi:hypothetical protein